MKQMEMRRDNTDGGEPNEQNECVCLHTRTEPQSVPSAPCPSYIHVDNITVRSSHLQLFLHPDPKWPPVTILGMSWIAINQEIQDEWVILLCSVRKYFSEEKGAGSGIQDLVEGSQDPNNTFYSKEGETTFLGAWHTRDGSSCFRQRIDQPYHEHAPTQVDFRWIQDFTWKGSTQQTSDWVFSYCEHSPALHIWFRGGDETLLFGGQWRGLSVCCAVVLACPVERVSERRTRAEINH